MTLPRDRELRKGVDGREVAGNLLAWYDVHRRLLPWRDLDAGDVQERAWAVWLSEVMAQQTRVEVVVPYWERFLTLYPRPADLASASEEEVLAQWAGLGYYRRARQLRAAAAEVVRRGGIPSSSAELRELPGVGPYTAAAVASIAFGEAVAVVDGNVERWLARFLALGGDPRRGATRRRVRAAAAAVLEPRRAGDSNQAMMELGARVCRPVGARCGECPVSDRCLALEEDRVAEIPPPRTRRPTERVVWRSALVESGGRVLLVRRDGADGVLAGFWELPSIVEVGDEAPERVAARIGARIGTAVALDAEPTVEVNHTITHRAITIRVHRGRLVSGAGGADEIRESGGARWWDPRAGREVPIGAATRKALAAAGLLPGGSQTDGASSD